MAKRKTNKSQAIRVYLEKDPEASAATVAKACKAKASLVYQVKAKMKSPTGGRKRKTARRGRSAAAVETNGSAEHVIAAAKLVQSCGSVAAARQALRAAEQVAAALEG